MRARGATVLELGSLMANAEHEPPEPAAADARIATRLNGWLRSARCSCWARAYSSGKSSGSISTK